MRSTARDLRQAASRSSSPRFNARFAVAAEQPERAYRPVPAELSLTEAINLKHTRREA